MTPTLLREAGESPKPIPGFAKYGATSDGRIWRIAPVLSTRYWGRSLPYELKQGLRHNGYWATNVENDEGRHRKVTTHRLILLAFRGLPPTDKPIGAHLDGDKKNNNANNLVWASQKENVNHKHEHGTMQRWQLMTEETSFGPDLLRECGTALYGSLWQSALARDLGVNDRTVRRWATGNSKIPDGLWIELYALLSVRGAAISAARRKLPL